MSEEMNEINGTPEPERFALYSRVSMKSQDPGLGLSDQLDAVIRFAESRGYQVVLTYTDTGSADTGSPDPD